MADVVYKAQPKNGEVARIVRYLKMMKRNSSGASIPSFSAQDINGKGVTDSYLRGKVAVVYTWADWSYESRNMRDRLLRLKGEYGNRLALLGISLDASRNTCRSGMARGADLYFVEAALALREKYPSLTVEGAVPCQSQADRWPAAERARWRSALDACDLETMVQHNYDRFCMHRRDRYMVDRSSVILAAFDGTPGGTMYTLSYAMDQGLDILLLDLNHPWQAAVRLERKD